MKKGVQLAFSLTFILLVGQSDLLAQNAQILKQNIQVQLRNGSIWEAVHEIANHGIPIGFEAREHSVIGTDPRVSTVSGTVEEVLNSIVQQDHYYTWEELDGIINVYPIKDRDPKSTMFLNTRIGPISFSLGEHRESVVLGINRMLAERVPVEEIRISSRTADGNLLGLTDGLIKEVKLPESDIRTVLNEITKAQSRIPLWAIRPSEKFKGIIVVL